MSPGPQLRDIHLPPEPSWWPPAPGWWLLAGIALLALALAWRWLRRRRARRRQRLALEQLMRQALSATQPPSARLAAASVLLRRACRRSDPKAATLSGEAWLRYLDLDDPERPFSRGPGRILADGPYRPQLPAAEVDALAPLLQDRLRRLASAEHAHA